MTKHPGIERRKRLKDEMKHFPTMKAIMKGDDPTIIKRKRRAPETKKREMGEKQLEGQIILRLKMRGCEVAKAGEDATYNSQFVLEGMSDLIVFYPGQGVVFMEVKQPKYKAAPDGGLRKTQVKFRDLCERCGLKYVVVYSVSDAVQAIKINVDKSLQ